MTESMTTRERRRQPLLIVNTGDGKGKTTAACGLALRGWAQGWDVGVYQFIKSGTWRVGEERAFRALGRLHDTDGLGGAVTWEHMGTGWTWTRPNRADGAPGAAEERAADAARAGWERIKQLLAERRHDLYVLDEFTYPMANGWVDIADVVATLRARPGHQHVAITGRRCPAEVLALADLATEMRPLAHPFERGQRGQAGIEW